MNESLLDNSNPQSLDPQKDYLAELVGEGKKFKDHESLARGKYEADAFIEILKRQQDDLRADYLKLREESATRAKLEELVDQLKNQRNSETTPSETRTQEIMPTIKPEDIESLFDRRFDQREQAKKQTENFKQVQAKLKEHFGSSYQDKLSGQLDQLGLTVDEANAMAKKNPQAFLKLMGADEHKQQSFQGPPSTTQRIPTQTTKQIGKTWSQWQEILKAKPNLKYDPSTNTQMAKDAVALGKAFMDGDYFGRYGHTEDSLGF